MPTNPHASAYLNSAYQRMLAQISDAQVPAFTIYPQADQFEYAKEQAEKIASALDEYFYALAVEANSHAQNIISTRDRISLVSDAIHDSSLLSDLQEAAERIREDELETA